MAKSWSGFVPQNQSIKEQWRVLEASQAEVAHIIEAIGDEEAEDACQRGEDGFEIEYLKVNPERDPF